MSAMITAVVGTTLLSAYSANQQGKAGERAAGLQADAAQRGVDETSRQFDAIQELLKPYIGVGGEGLQGQIGRAGLAGADAQRQAIQQIEQSPQLAALTRQGEGAILANASATGGLRGGNVQGALAEFRPQMLQALIDQQYSRMGGLAQIGQNSAVMQGNFGQQAGANISNLYQQQGAALAGGALARGRESAGYANAIMSGMGMYGGMGGFGAGNAGFFQGMMGAR